MTEQVVDGELEQADGTWRLRFTRRLSHPPQKVWRAVTEADHLSHWFPDRLVGEFRVGAALRFESDYVDGGYFEGAVLAVQPPELLEFSWGTDVIRIEIAPDGEGSVLTLLDSIDEVGKAARDGAGWHVCLDKLALHLEGSAPSWSDGERWSQLHGGYVVALGPEAATIGPPDGAG